MLVNFKLARYFLKFFGLLDIVLLTSIGSFYTLFYVYYV